MHALYLWKCDGRGPETEGLFYDPLGIIYIYTNMLDVRGILVPVTLRVAI